MQEEILRILKMVEEGKLKADEASKLIDAINAKKSESEWIDLNQPLTEEGESDQSGPEPVNARKPKWLFILVQKGDKKNIKVRIPITLARWALRFVPKHAQVKMKEELGEEFDLSEIAQIIDQLPVDEDLVNVMNDDEDERVRIFVR